VAWSVERERQLTGIINPDDRFQASGSACRLSRLDPLETFIHEFSRRQSGHWAHVQERNSAAPSRP
jgi:hypothetical protein